MLRKQLKIVTISLIWIGSPVFSAEHKTSILGHLSVCDESETASLISGLESLTTHETLSSNMTSKQQELTHTKGLPISTRELKSFDDFNALWQTVVIGKNVPYTYDEKAFEESDLPHSIYVCGSLTIPSGAPICNIRFVFSKEEDFSKPSEWMLKSDQWDQTIEEIYQPKVWDGFVCFLTILNQICTQQVLADCFHVDQSTISRVLNGQIHNTAQKPVLILQNLSVGLDNLKNHFFSDHFGKPAYTGYYHLLSEKGFDLMLRMLSEKLNAPLIPKPEWFWLCRNRVFLQAVAGFLNLCLLDKITANEFEEEHEQGIEIPIEGEEKVTLLGLPVIQEGEEEEKAEEAPIIPTSAATLIEEPSESLSPAPFSCEPLESLASTVTSALSDEERIFEGISLQDRIIPPGVKRRPTPVILKIIENFFMVEFGMDMPRTMDEYDDIDDEKIDVFYDKRPVNSAERNEWFNILENKKRIIQPNAFEMQRKNEIEQEFCSLEQRIAQYNPRLLNLLDVGENEIVNPLHLISEEFPLENLFTCLNETRPLELRLYHLLQDYDKVTHPGYKRTMWVHLTKPLTEEEKAIKQKLEEKKEHLIQENKRTTILLFEEEKNLHVIEPFHMTTDGLLAWGTDTTPQYDEYFEKGVRLGQKIKIIEDKLHYLTRA